MLNRFKKGEFRALFSVNTLGEDVKGQYFVYLKTHEVVKFLIFSMCRREYKDPFDNKDIVFLRMMVDY